MRCYENISKYKHWDIKSVLGQPAKQTLLSKPCVPLTRPGRVWFGVDVTVYTISPSRKPKCTCPTLTQQDRTRGMRSDEEGSHKSSGHWFPFHGLSPPRQTSSPQAGSHLGCYVAYRQGSTADLGAPSHHWPQSAPVDMTLNSPDTEDLFVSSGMLMHVNHIILLPSFGVILSLPKTHCPSVFPLHPAPTRPTSWEAFFNPFS